MIWPLFVTHFGPEKLHRFIGQVVFRMKPSLKHLKPSSSNGLWEYPTGNERWHGELTSLTGDVARNEEEWIHVLACAFVVAYFSKTVTASGSSESTGRRRSDRTQRHFYFHSIVALVSFLRGDGSGESVGCAGCFVVWAAHRFFISQTIHTFVFTVSTT